MESNKKILFAFDMDNTILSDNTDYVIRDLLNSEEKNKINEQIGKDWIKEMNLFYSKFQEKGIGVEAIKNIVQSIPLTNGFESVFDLVKSYKNKEVVIISGANVIFVKWVIEKHNLNFVDQYYSINAEVNGSLFSISKYHDHNCKRCDPCFCKFEVANEVFTNKDYDKVFYFGDGLNDHCAVKAFQEKYDTYFFIRKDYSLYKNIYFLYSEENNYDEQVLTKLGKEIKATIIVFTDGVDLVERIRDCI